MRPFVAVVFFCAVSLQSFDFTSP